MVVPDRRQRPEMYTEKSVMLVQTYGLACEPHGSSGMTFAGRLHFCDRYVNKFNQKHLAKKQGTHSQTPIHGPWSGHKKPAVSSGP